MKANTIEQFHLLEFVKANFIEGFVQIELLTQNKIKINDLSGNAGIFTYRNGNITFAILNKNRKNEKKAIAKGARK